ncbi:MAG: hypothetical protein M3416_16460 [Acidobacteriota bacterium]|nr:hypothetical protein [Acidobacteriota bacterium]
MIAIRQSAAAQPNEQLNETAHKERQSNAEWLKAVGISEGIILLGGSSVAHFRLRVAQSHLRRDLTPSCWSFAGLLDRDTIVSVPFDLAADASEIVVMNGVQNCRVADYDDPERFPNIAVLSFASDFGEVIRSAELLSKQRSIIDLPALVLHWLGYLWSTGQVGNPLLAGYGVPSAVFVETVYGMTGVELTPGLSSSASCPEAIWQSAKWWHNFYEGDSGAAGEVSDVADPSVPKGFFLLRQPAATAVGPKDHVVGSQVVRRDGDESQKGGSAKASKQSRKTKRGGGKKTR